MRDGNECDLSRSGGTEGRRPERLETLSAVSISSYLSGSTSSFLLAICEANDSRQIVDATFRREEE